jgi:hypothetical protein
LIVSPIFRRRLESARCLAFALGEADLFGDFVFFAFKNFDFGDRFAAGFVFFDDAVDVGKVAVAAGESSTTAVGVFADQFDVEHGFSS